MHANARLTPLMRAQMAREHLQLHRSLRESAAAYSVSEKTIRTWLKRAREKAFLKDGRTALRFPIPTTEDQP